MAQTLNRTKSGGLYVSWPCRYQGMWCSCWRHLNGDRGRICKHKGNYIRNNFSGGMSEKEKSTIQQAGLGAGLFTILIVVGGLIFIMSKIGKE